MIKIIIPIDEDTLDGVAALLKMELKKNEARESLKEAIVKIKQDGSAEINSEFLKGEGEEAVLGIAMMAIASNIPKD